MELTRRKFFGVLSTAVAAVFVPKVAVAEEVIPESVEIDWQSVAIELAEGIRVQSYNDGDECPRIPCEHSVAKDFSNEYSKWGDDEVAFSFESRELVGCAEMNSRIPGTKLPCGATLEFKHSRVYIGRYSYNPSNTESRKLQDAAPERFAEITEKGYGYIDADEYYRLVGELPELYAFKMPCEYGYVFPSYCTCDSERVSYEYEEYDCTGICHRDTALQAAVMSVVQREVDAEAIDKAKAKYYALHKAAHADHAFKYNRREL